MPLVILGVALFSLSLIFFHDIRGRGFLMLGFAIWCLIQMPALHDNWMVYKKDEGSFYVIVGVFFLVFLSEGIILLIVSR